MPEKIAQQLEWITNLATLKTMDKDKRKEILESMIAHLNTIDDNDDVTKEERHKARDLLVQIRRLDLDEKKELDNIAKDTGVNLTGLSSDILRFSQFESGSVVVDWGDKDKVWAAFNDALVTQFWGIPKERLMIMAQKWYDLTQWKSKGSNPNVAKFAPRYDLAVGPVLTAASEKPADYINSYIKWFNENNSQGSGGDSTLSIESPETAENGEKPEWLSKIDLGTIGSWETWQTVLKRAGAIDDKNQPVAYLKSLLSLDNKFWGDYKLTVSVLANLDKTQDTYTDWDNLYDSDGMSKSTEAEENDIVVTDKNGKAVALGDNPGKMSTFQVDGTGYFDNYRFDSVATFIKFIDQLSNGEEIKDTKDGEEIALEKFGSRLEWGKDGAVATYMKEKKYIDADGDIDNQFNSLMSLPDEAWGDYRLTLGDIQRFEDSSTYEAGEFNPANQNNATKFGIDLLQARFWWDGKNLVMSDLMDNDLLARSDLMKTKFTGVADLMQFAKKMEDTTPENFDLQKWNTGLEKMKKEDRYKALDTQMKEFSDRFPLSKFGHTVAEDGNSITISRDGGKRKTIYRNGDQFEIRLGDVKHKFELWQAAAMANMLVFADKYTNSDGNRVAGSNRPFKEDGNGIDFDRSNEWSNPVSWFDNEGEFLAKNDSWANYYEKQIGTKKMVEVLNDWYETTKPAQKSEV